MPRIAMELKPLEVQRLTRRLPESRPFNYFPVGGTPGLLLRVAKTGACYWVLRIAIGQKTTNSGKQAPRRRDIGLGSYPEISLKAARDLAGVKRSQVRDGIDPVEARKEARTALQASAAQLMSFADAVALARELESIGEDKAGKAWTYKLETYAIPTLGHMPITTIQREHIAEVLLPIWASKTRTAKDVRKLIEDVLNRAFATKNINRNNPARWDKLLKQRLPRETKKGSNFPALPFTLINTFLVELRKRTDTAAPAVEFVIYTAARSGEVCGATWREIDLDRKLWTIPATRMKKGEEHRIHLSAPAMAILRALPEGKPDDPIFPTATGKHHQDARLSKVAREIGGAMGYQATVHGFRATFRTWGEEETEYPEPILEMALAHKIDDAVKAAYQRGDLLKKRRALLDDWAAYCAKSAPRGDLLMLKTLTN